MASKPSDIGILSGWRRPVFSALVMIGLFALIFTVAPIGPTFAALKRVRPVTILLVLLVSTGSNIFMYADRWRRTLMHIGMRVSFAETLCVHLATGPLRLLFPIQVGEVVTAATLARRAGGSTSRVLGSILYGKYLSLAASLLLLAAGLLAGASAETRLLRATAIMSCAALLLFLSLEGRLVREFATRAASRFHPSLGETAGHFFATFEEIPRAGKLRLYAYSVLFQATEIVSCKLLLDDMGIVLPLSRLIVDVQILVLAASLPISFAGVGSREGVALILLAPFGAPASAVAFGLAYSLFEYLWPMITGLPLLPWLWRSRPRSIA